MKFTASKRKNRNRPEEISDRAGILENLRKAVSGKEKAKSPDRDEPFFTPLGDEMLADSFSTMLANVNGRVFFTRDGKELAQALSAIISANGWQEIVCPEDPIRELLLALGIRSDLGSSLSITTDAVISGCEYLIASTGSVLVSSGQAGSRRMFIYPPVHVVVSQTSQLVETPEEAMQRTIDRYGDKLPSLLSFITGPSRTADIEKTLVMGAHGPEKLFVFIANHDFLPK